MLLTISRYFRSTIVLGASSMFHMMVIHIDVVLGGFECKVISKLARSIGYFQI